MLILIVKYIIREHSSSPEKSPHTFLLKIDPKKPRNFYTFHLEVIEKYNPGISNYFILLKLKVAQCYYCVVQQYVVQTMPDAFLMPHSGYHMYAPVKMTESVNKYSSDLVLGVTCLYMTNMVALMSQTFLIQRKFLFLHLIIYFHPAL